MKNNKHIAFVGVPIVVFLLLGAFRYLDNYEAEDLPQSYVNEYESDTEDYPSDEDLSEEYFYSESITTEAPTNTGIPTYKGIPYVEVNNNRPWFTDEDKTRTDAFELYADLDSLGRCGAAYANICPELMPTEERGPIGHIKPSGWHSVKYPEQIKDNYLYNRCHLIAFCLAGENDNEKNLITGTRYLNIDGMLPFEEKVARYVDDTGNHVLYRVTPVFEGDNLIASGVYIEAYSVEDNGTGICFNVYCYNVQPGIGIDYASGNSWIEENQ